MSRILLVAHRDKLEVGRVVRLCSSMAPDNIDVPPPAMMVAGGLVGGICNPDHGSPQSPNAFVAGHFFNDEPNWDAIGDHRPDGSYALCRWSDVVVQIVTDATGSRSLWYAVTETKFVVSSSIGAIVELLGQFIFDERVIPWMIATGSLGEYSWDKRIKRCPADSVLSFDRRTWSVSIQSRPVEFVEAPTRLDHLLNHRFAHLQLPEGSIVTLSGGVDSRAILAAMPDPAVVPSITWGTADGALDPQNDVAVAKRVAQQLSSPHRFLPLEKSEVTIAEIVERFIDVSEGRIDHLAGYADGLALWKMLYETGIRRIIRGDEGFGWNVAFNETQARRDLGLLRMSDYFSQEQREQFALEEVMWPESYHWRPTETLATWRDRLYHEFRIPTVLASLNDIKAGYVEIVNPLLARDLVDAVRKLPDAERTEKRAFRRWAAELGPKFPYAKAGGTKRIEDLLRTRDFVDMAEREIGSSPVLPEQFRSLVIDKLRKSLEERRAAQGLKAWLRKTVPKGVKARFRASKGEQRLVMEPAGLALRAIIIARMHRTLSARAASTDMGQSKTSADVPLHI